MRINRLWTSIWLFAGSLCLRCVCRMEPASIRACNLRAEWTFGDLQWSIVQKRDVYYKLILLSFNTVRDGTQRSTERSTFQPIYKSEGTLIQLIFGPALSYTEYRTARMWPSQIISEVAFALRNSDSTTKRWLVDAERLLKVALFLAILLSLVAIF